MIDSDLFTRARNIATIEMVAGVKLRPASGLRGRGPCPLCCPNNTRADVFSVDRVKQKFHCHRCGEGGDVVDLEFALRGYETLADAARYLAGVGLPRAVPPRPAQPQTVLPPRPDAGSAEIFTAKVAEGLWLDSARAEGSLAEIWLRNRGCHGPALDMALAKLRYHDAAYHHGDRFGAVTYPALIAPVMAPAGWTGGVQAIYLSRDGKGYAKTPNDRAKIMWGSQSLGGVLGGVWLTRRDLDAPLIVAEGIVTALSYACLQDSPVRVLAALSLNRLSGTAARDAYGSIDPDMPGLGQSGLTWPEAEKTPWGSVTVCVDHDMADIKVKAKGLDGLPCERRLDATQRAQLSGKLAALSWEAAGVREVNVATPPLGMDWNNVLMRERGLVRG